MSGSWADQYVWYPAMPPIPCPFQGSVQEVFGSELKMKLQVSEGFGRHLAEWARALPAWRGRSADVARRRARLWTQRAPLDTREPREHASRTPSLDSRAGTSPW